MSQYQTKIWKLDWDHTEDGLFRAIAYKERLYHELISLWIRKHPEYDWDYKIEVGEIKVFIEVVLTNDPTKTSKRDIKEDS